MDQKPTYEELEKRVQEFEQERSKSKRGEEELRKSQQLLEGILNAIPVRVFWKDQDLVYLGCNTLFAKDAGFAEPNDLIGKDDYQMGWRDQAELYRNDDRTVIESGESKLLIEEPQTTPTGDTITLLTSKIPLRGPMGEINGVLGTYMDITALKQTEKALQESEKLYRHLFDQASEGLISMTLDRQLHRVNGAFAEMHGYSVDELKHMDLMDLEVLKERLLEDPADIIRRLEAGETIRFEVEHYHKDGHIFPLSVTTSMINIEGEKYVLAFHQDITERKQAEKKLKESHDLLENLASLVPGVIYQYRLYPDGSSAFPYSSQGINDIYEVTPEQVREDASAVFGRLHPEDHDKVAEAIFESARTLNTFYSEFRVKLPRQGLRWRWSQANPQRMEDGGTLWHGIIVDISDRKLAEEEQTKLKEQLQQAQKMEAVGRLAGGVAHDFNNMLSVIIGHAEMAMEEVDPAQPLYANLEQIKNAGERSADLTRQLLAFARKQTVAPKVLDLNKTVGGMTQMLQRLIGEDIDLAWMPYKNLWPVKMDPSQIDQILANLCVNARDAIADVGKITIETGNVEFDETYCNDHVGFLPGEYVLLAVSDNGCGMDTETLDNIFEPFFTTKESGKGTGLGLATVYGVVKQNNGFINVYSEPGQGTTFRIYLPRHLTKTAQLSEKEVNPPPERGNETILLVEDEPAILKMTTMMLERLGYTVVAAGTPAEAINLAHEYTGIIDLLVTDVVMPEMNGRNLAKNILSFYPNLKRLFMSGYTANVIAHHGVLDEGVNFIQKPFSRENLGTKVRELLDQ